MDNSLKWTLSSNRKPVFEGIDLLEALDPDASGKAAFSLHGGPTSPTGCLDPADRAEWAEFAGNPPSGTPASTLRWLESEWRVFAQNGLQTLSQLLFQLASISGADVRLWVFFIGVPIFCYEKRQSPMQMLSEIDANWRQFARYQYDHDAINRDVHSFRRCLLVQRVFSADQLLRIGLLCEASPFDNIFVGMTGVPSRAESEMEALVFGAGGERDRNLLEVVEGHLPELVEESTLIAVGHGADLEDMLVVVPEWRTCAILDNLRSFALEHGTVLNMGP